MPTCHVCQKNFQNPSSLIQHMEAVHPEAGSVVMQEADVLAVAGAFVVVAGAAAVTAAAAVKALKPDVMQRYTLAADEHGGTEPVEERIIEYERKLPFKGFSSGHLFPNGPSSNAVTGAAWGCRRRRTSCSRLRGRGWMGTGVLSQARRPIPLAQTARGGCMPSIGLGMMGTVRRGG